MVELIDLGFKVDTKQLDRGERALNKFERSGKRAERSTNSLSKSTNQLKSSVRETVSPVRSLQTALAGVGVALGAREIIQYADSYTVLNARLKLVTNSTEEFEFAQRRLFDISNKVRAPIATTAQFYAELSRATKSLDLSQNDLLEITEAVGSAIAVTGGNSASAAAALLQLQQAFAGDFQASAQEINSIAEQAPAVAEIIFDGLEEIGFAADVTKKKFKQLAEEGQISSALVAEAIQSQLGRIRGDLEQFPVTVGQSLTILNNELGKFIGVNNEALGATGALASGIVDLSQNLDSVITLAGAAAAVISSKLIGSVVSSTQAFIANTAASIASSKADLQKTASANAAAQAELRAAQAAAARTPGFFLNAAAVEGLARAEARAEAATNAYTAATTRAAVASRAFGASLAFLGGPVGIAITGLAIGFSFLTSEQEDATDAGEEYANVIERINALTKTSEELTANRTAILKEDTKAVLDATEAEIELLNTRLEALRRAEDISSGMSGFEGDGGMFAEGLDVINPAIRETEKAIEEARKKVAELRSGLSELNNQTSENSETGKKLTKATEDQLKAFNQLRDAARNAQNELRGFLTGGEAGQLDAQQFAEAEQIFSRIEAAAAKAGEEVGTTFNAIIREIRLRDESNKLLDDAIEKQREKNRLSEEVDDAISGLNEQIALLELEVSLGRKATDAERERLRYKKLLANADGMQMLVLTQLISQLEVLRNDYEALSGPLSELGRQSEITGEKIEQSIVNGLTSAEDALVDFVVNGKASFKDFANSIIEDIARILIRSQITAPIAQSIGSSGIVGSIGNFFGGLFANGGAFDGGVQKFANGGAFTNSIVTRPTNFNMGQMGEAGPEAIIPLERSYGGKLGVNASGLGQNVIVQNIDQRSEGQPVETTQERGPNGELIIRNLIRDEVTKGIGRGNFDKPFRDTFGLSRRGSF
tara:strand:+ start:39113 stop:41941 length:2829 start_codon:yes stop_codon:yes gene_type:complete